MLELLVRAAPATRQFALEEARLPHRLDSAGAFALTRIACASRSMPALAFVLQAREAPSKVAWVVLLPVGLALYLRDLRRLR